MFTRFTSHEQYVDRDTYVHTDITYCFHVYTCTFLFSSRRELVKWNVFKLAGCSVWTFQSKISISESHKPSGNVYATTTMAPRFNTNSQYLVVNACSCALVPDLIALKKPPIKQSNVKNRVFEPFVTLSGRVLELSIYWHKSAIQPENFKKSLD